MSPDIELLRRFTNENSDEAFATLVGRHVDLVYSAARRQVFDPHLAEEVAQRVFILLARKARWMGAGTILSGWLFRATRFIAAEVLRSQNRQRIRDRKAMQPPDEPGGDPPWTAIEPLLDEGMARLTEADRNVLLLRFFQNHSFKEVGAALGINEDTAQKRVARSLDKLRQFFAKRGTVVPMAGLGAALSALAVQAAPVGVGSSIVSAVAAAGSGATIGTLVLEALTYMTTTTKIAVITAALLAVLSVPTVKQWHISKELRSENATLRNQNRRLLADQQELAERLQAEHSLVDQLQRNIAELPQLRGQVSALRRQAGRSSEPGAEPDKPGNDAVNDPSKHTDPMARMNRGRELRKQGKPEEALREYLWCFDEGNRDPAFTGVRVSFLLSEIASLAMEIPSARQALIARRDAAEAAILSGTSSSGAVFDFAALNKNLQESEKNLALFDQLPADSAIRANLVKAASDQFLAAKRYQDIAEASDPEAAFFQRLSLVAASNGGTSSDLQFRSRLRATETRLVLEAGANGLEVLAGLGENERAKALAEKVLRVDRSDEVLTQLIDHAQRAGNAEVAAYLKGKQPSADPPAR